MTPPKGYYKDLVGMEFNAWTVLSFCEHIKGTTVWLCKCKCGKERRVKSNNLHNGASRHCGCMKTRKGWIKGYVGYIPLTKGKAAAVSVHRIEDLQRWNWYAVKKKGLWYAYRSCLQGEEVEHMSMARYILGLDHSDERVADHKNRRTLDNRDRNLRPATDNQSQVNKAVRRDSVTGVKGIRRCKAKGEFVGRFQVRLTHMGVCLHLGTYDTLEEAQKIRNEVALKLHGEFAVIKGN
jgi:hypothetical protein